MLSIIVAIHNQIGHNQLFLEGLRKYTSGSYEIIVVDNNSTDGSADYCEANGCRVIRNKSNLCYPESMNMGLLSARGDYICFLNNDVYVGPNWDTSLIDAMEEHGLDAVCPLGLEQMPTRALTDWMHGRWDAIGRWRHSGMTPRGLYGLIESMYGDWECFCLEVRRCFYPRLLDGIIGSCVMVKRSLIDKIGLLDERIQAADWDLYYTLRKREEEVGDVHRAMIVSWVYVHHFMRATLKGKPEPFSCKHPRLSIDQKWSREEQVRLWCKPWEFHRDSSSGKQPLRVRLGRRLLKVLVGIKQNARRMVTLCSLPRSPKRVVDMYKSKFSRLLEQ